MAYKFQLGTAVMSGALAQQGEFQVQSDINEATLYTIERTAGNVSGSGTLYSAGAASFSAAVASSGSITAGTSFIIGSADLNEADMEKLDGITNGTAAASKAMVTDASNNIASLGTLGCGQITSTGTVTAVGSFIIGSADLNEADMEKLDGITNGTAAASKAMVTDASNNIASLGTLGCGAITSTGASSLGSLGVGALSSSAAVMVVGTFESIGAIASSGSITAGAGVAAGGAITTATSIDGSGDLTMGTITMTGFSVDADGDTVVKTLSSGDVAAGASTFTSISGSGAFTSVGSATIVGSLDTSGSVKLAGVAAAAVAVASDSLYFLDGDGLMKSESFVDYAAALAGDGLSASGGVLALDMNELTEAAVNVASDSLIFIDADGNVTRKDTWADYATAIAGAGITATNGVLSTDAAVTSTGVGDANATLTEGFTYGTATLSADRTWTLPAAPSTNDICRVKAPAALGGNELIIAVNGGTSHLIDGNSAVVVDSAGGALAMQYVGSDTWLIY